MKNKKLSKKILLFIFVFLVVSVTTYVYGSAPKPDKFVLDYLDVRYTDTDYLSIVEKAEQQKQYLNEELINSDFIFGKFDEEIKYFNECKYIIEKAEFNVYDVQKQSESIDIFARVYFSVKSDVVQGWNQLTFYELQFRLNKVKGRYEICDIIVLDCKYQIPDAITTHVHDENCTHD